MPYFEREKKQWLKQFSTQVRNAFAQDKDALRDMVNVAESIRDMNGKKVKFATDAELKSALISLDAKDGQYKMDSRVSAGVARGGYTPEEIASMPPSQQIRYFSVCATIAGPKLEGMHQKYSDAQYQADNPGEYVTDQTAFISTLFQAGKEIFDTQAKMQATRDARQQMSDSRTGAAAEPQEESASWQRYMGRFH